MTDLLAPIRARVEAWETHGLSRTDFRAERDCTALLAALDAVLAGLAESAAAFRATSDRMGDEVMTGKERHSAEDLTRYAAYANNAENARARAKAAVSAALGGEG